jgi:hypothetical protein
LYLLILQGKQIQKNLTFKIEIKTKQIGSLTVQRNFLKLLPPFCVDPIQASSSIPGAGVFILKNHSPTTSPSKTEVILCKLQSLPLHFHTKTFIFPTKTNPVTNYDSI